MPVEIYVSNTDPDTPLEDAQAFFKEFGSVEEIKPHINMITQQKRDIFRVMLDIDENDEDYIHNMCNSMTGRTLNGATVYVCPFKPIKARQLSPEENAKCMAVAERLQEDSSVPLNQLRQLWALVGENFIDLLMEEAFLVEDEGGMLTADRTRRRTIGGVFFQITRKRISYKTTQAVFGANRRKKRKNKDNKSNNKKAAPQKTVKKVQQKPPSPPAPPISSGEPVTDEVLAEYHELKAKYDVAFEKLEALKKQGAGKRGAGLFSATREVVNLQKQMNDLKKKHPGING